MELHILPHRLHIASIKKKDIHLFSHSLIKLSLLHKNTSCKFFSFTETCDDFSFIVDELGFEEIEWRPELSVQPTLWLVLNVIPTGSHGNAGLTVTTKSLVILLADEKISIFSLSTYQTDFILVKEADYDQVIQCLQPHFKIMRESEDGEMKAVSLEENEERPLQSKDRPSIESARPIVHSFQSPDNRFLMTCLQPEQMSHISTALLKLMFYSDSFLPAPKDGHERFLSLSIINDKISLVVDMESLALFPVGSICTGGEEHWRLIKIGNMPLGFDECGIVAQISEPLAEQNISMYYISTFLSDHTLVSEEDIEHSLSILRSRQVLGMT